jgi:hypothetical protein
MSKIPIVYNSFEGGWSSDIKYGAPSTFWFSRSLDFRKSPSQLSILPGMAKESGSVVTGLVTEMIQLPSGKMVAIDSSGSVYQRSTGGTWTKEVTVLTSTAFGMVYNLQQDTIYIPGQTKLHNITNADGRFSGGVFTVNEGAIAQLQDQASVNGHAQSYSTTGAISEAAVDRQAFTPTIEPLYSIKVWVTTKGSGSLTITMHDAANNVLGTSTLANGSITNGAYNEFVFATPVRMYAKPNPASYHFHATHPSGTAHVLGTSVASSLATADYLTLSNRLVQPNNGFHQVIEFLQYYCFLNERYLAVWEPISQSAPSSSELQQHRLVFPSGYEGTSMALYTQYIAVAAERRSTSATNEFQDGKIFLWDGTAQTYNLIINVPEGAPYGLHSHSNRLYWFAGGAWWAWAGGNPVKVFQMRGTDFEFSAVQTYLVNYPNTMTVRNGILLAAFPSETNSLTLEYGVYGFGRRDKNYPEGIGHAYSMSTGSLTNGTLRIGMLKNFGDKLFMSWRDGSTYGVDKVDNSSNPASTATFEALISDIQVSSKNRLGRVDKDKQATYLVISFKPLPTGATVTPKIKLDRASVWTNGDTAVAGDTTVKLQVNNRYKETQVGYDLTATTTTPEILGAVLVTDNLDTEED